VDNCIISSLSKISRLHFLKHFQGVVVAHGVIEEALNSDIPQIIDSLTSALKDWLEQKTVNKPEEIPQIQKIHPHLSYVDCELILLCSENQFILLTDDKDLIRIAENEFNIDTFDLCQLLLTLKRKKVLNLKEIDEIIIALEKKDSYKFSHENLLLLRK